jgi:ethanolamine utilization microcompartment shell protein EutS
MVNTQLVRSPSESTMELIKGRMGKRARDLLEEMKVNFDCVGLVQGTMVEMIAAADIADKASLVHVTELLGLCPQHFSMLAVFGEMEAVSTALEAIDKQLGQGKQTYTRATPTLEIK